MICTVKASKITLLQMNPEPYAHLMSDSSYNPYITVQFYTLSYSVGSVQSLFTLCFTQLSQNLMVNSYMVKSKARIKYVVKRHLQSFLSQQFFGFLNSTTGMISLYQNEYSITIDICLLDSLHCCLKFSYILI